MSDKLKITPAMQRILNRANKESTKDEFKGETITFSDFFVNAMKSVPGIKIEDFEFYYYAYRSEMIDRIDNPTIDIIFEYHAQARDIHEVHPWHEIFPKIAKINCGAYTLMYNGSKFIPIKDTRQVVIHYRIQKNELPGKLDEKELKLKEESSIKLEKREVKHAKSYSDGK